VHREEASLAGGRAGQLVGAGGAIEAGDHAEVGQQLVGAGRHLRDQQARRQGRQQRAADLAERGLDARAIGGGRGGRQHQQRGGLGRAARSATARADARNDREVLDMTRRLLARRRGRREEICVRNDWLLE
jgi:hypothetical protein